MWKIAFLKSSHILVLGTDVYSLVIWSCRQVQEAIIAQGENVHWKSSFDGFYLTWVPLNNASATLYDVVSNLHGSHIDVKRIGLNWVGTSSGAEEDMLCYILDDVKESGFQITQLVMDHDTSSSNIACAVFPEIQITVWKSLSQNIPQISSKLEGNTL